MANNFNVIEPRLIILLRNFLISLKYIIGLRTKRMDAVLENASNVIARRCSGYEQGLYCTPTRHSLFGETQ